MKLMMIVLPGMIAVLFSLNLAVAAPPTCRIRLDTSTIE